MLRLLWDFVVGVLVGYLARIVLPGADRIGFWMTALVGVAGSFGGHWIAKKAGVGASGKPMGRALSVAISVGGAVVLLVLLRLVHQ